MLIFSINETIKFICIFKAMTYLKTVLLIEFNNYSILVLLFIFISLNINYFLIKLCAIILNIIGE